MEIPGQMSLFDICDSFKPRTMNDWWKAEREGKEFLFSQSELKAEQKRQGGFLSFYFYEGEKCCECFPLLRQIRKGFKDLSYCQCLVCGRKTEPVEDYSWMETKKAWDMMMKGEKHGNQG